MHQQRHTINTTQKMPNLACTTHKKATKIIAMASLTHTYHRNTKTIKIRKTPIIPEKLNVQKNHTHRTVSRTAHLQQLYRNPYALTKGYYAIHVLL